MVFDDHGSSSNPLRFPQQHDWIVGMVQDVHKQHHVDAVVRVRDVPSVEDAKWKLSVLTDQDIDALDSKIGTQLEETSVHRSITRPDVEDARLVGKQLRDRPREPADATSMNQPLVEGSDHERLIPRMLTKPLDRTVWKPRAARVTPGITFRIVTA